MKQNNHTKLLLFLQWGITRFYKMSIETPRCIFCNNIISKVTMKLRNQRTLVLTKGTHSEILSFASTGDLAQTNEAVLKASNCIAFHIAECQEVRYNWGGRHQASGTAFGGGGEAGSDQCNKQERQT